MAWFKSKKSKPQAADETPECANSDTGKHVWQSWTDTTGTRTWRECEAGCGAREDA